MEATISPVVKDGDGWRAGGGLTGFGTLGHVEESQSSLGLYLHVSGRLTASSQKHQVLCHTSVNLDEEVFQI